AGGGRGSDLHRDRLQRHELDRRVVLRGDLLPQAVVTRGDAMAAYGATLLRFVLGIVYIMHAYLAAVVFGPAGMIAYQTTNGGPFAGVGTWNLSGPPGMIAYQTKNGVPFAEVGTWYLILADGLGGICLVLGLFTRWAALANV